MGHCSDAKIGYGNNGTVAQTQTFILEKKNIILHCTADQYQIKANVFLEQYTEKNICKKFAKFTYVPSTDSSSTPSK